MRQVKGQPRYIITISYESGVFHAKLPTRKSQRSQIPTQRRSQVLSVVGKYFHSGKTSPDTFPENLIYEVSRARADRLSLELRFIRNLSSFIFFFFFALRAFSESLVMYVLGFYLCIKWMYWKDLGKFLR